jgi:hypothetical protein
VKAPAGAGDVEAVGDQVAAGALDRSGGDRPAVFQRRVVVELIEVAGQVAGAGIDSLAPGSGHVFPLSLAGHFGGSVGSLTCEDGGKTVGGPRFGLVLRLTGVTNIAAGLRRNARDTRRQLTILGLA